MKVVWSDRAVDSLEEIYAFIAEDSEYYASLVVEDLVLSVDKLEDFPRIGRRVPEVDEESLRELIQGPYRILYEIETNRILILSVVHGRRDIEGMDPRPWQR